MEPGFPPAPAAAPSTGELFIAFLAVGMSGFGGVLPFARRALVERQGWLSEAGFTETLALCQSLPGPNIVNLAVVVGARFAGARGALACVSGLVVAPVALVLLLATLWSRFGADVHVGAAIRGLGAAAAGLVAATSLRMAGPALRKAPLSAGPLMAAAFVGVGLLRLPLPWVLLVLAPVGVLIARRRGP